MTAIETRVLDLRFSPEDEPLPLTNATAAGEVDGWRVEAQCRTRAYRAMLLVRITAPDGRRLTLADNLILGKTSPRGPVNVFLSPAVGSIFRATRSLPRAVACQASVERVFTVGWDLASHPVYPGPGEARDQVQAAAHGLPLALLDYWRTGAAEWARSEDSAEAPPSTGSSPDRDLTAAKVAALAATGLTPAEAFTWLRGASVEYTSVAEIHQMQVFRSAGWSREQVWDVGRALFSMEHHGSSPWQTAATPTAWAAVPPRQALLAVKAGLSLTETRRLFKTGSFDEEAVRTIAVLRSKTAVSASGADLVY